MGVVGKIIKWKLKEVMEEWKMGNEIENGWNVVLKNEEKKKINEIKIDEIVKEDGINEGVVNVIKGYGKKEGEDI